MSDTPNFIFEGTPEQRVYAAEMVHNRLRAEARLTNGKAALWYLGGIGFLLALMGVGIGAGLWGYSKVADVTNTAEHLADTLKTVLERVNVQTTGEVKLADGGTVKLDADGETVGLQPGGTVRVEGGTVKVDGGSMRSSAPASPSASASPILSAPSTAQMQGATSYAQDKDGKLVVEFTRFNYRPFANGQVTTGWKFHDNTEERPYTQYCYYRPAGAFSDTIIDLAEDGLMIANDGVSSIDRDAAAQECRWFDGSSTRTTAVTPSDDRLLPTPSTPATPQPFAPSTMAKPSAGASFSDWQNWCRATYPATVQEWCLKEFAPKTLRAEQTPQPQPQPKQTVPVVNERLRMDPVQRKAL